MGTPWGCPTTGGTPSERKQSQQPGQEAAELVVVQLSGLGVGLSMEVGEHNMGWGAPPRPHLLGHRKPKFTP